MRTSRRRFLKGAGTAALTSMAAPSAAAQSAGASPVAPPRDRRPGETVLAFAGDLFLTARFPDPPPPDVAPVFDVLRAADAAFANLENGLSTTGSGDLGGYKFGAPIRGNPSLVRELTSLGIDAVSVANNHTCNYGRDALLETLRTLDQANIRHSGAGRNIDEAFVPALMTVNGLRVAFFSVYSLHYGRISQELATETLPGVAFARAYDVVMETPGHFTPSAKSTVFDLDVNPAQTVMAPIKEDVDRLKSAIANARSRADLVILYVHFHWARHTRAALPYHQRVVAHAAIEAGADILFASGPHVIRGVEIYRGRPVLYSIGNFVLQAKSEAAPVPPSVPLTEQSVIVRARVAADKSIALEFFPIVFGSDGQPRFARGAGAAAIVARLRALSAEFDIEIAQQDWYGTLRVGRT